MESKIVKADFKRIEGFLKSLKGSGDYVVRVGIMGSKNSRPGEGGLTNADIGFIHEYGKPATVYGPAIPMRSFLRFPINFKSKRILKEVSQDADVKKLEKGNIRGMLEDLGIACERAIMDAFDTAGFSTWAKNAPMTIRLKGSSQPLIDLGFLRKSITSEVVGK